MRKIKKPTRAIWVAMLLVMVAGFWGVSALGAQEVVPWERAEAIRAAGLEAQTALFRTEPDFVAITDLVGEMGAIYEESLGGEIRAVAPDLDDQIRQSLAEATTAVSNNDSPALALARGQIWTRILHGSYLVTLDALERGEVEKAASWLRLREYRRSTIVNLVSSPADAAMRQVLRETITPADAALIVDSDLRDTTFFRLREAITELEEATESQFQTRAAEWVGKLEGYYALLAEDFVTKQGVDANREVREILGTLNQAAVRGDWPSLTAEATDLRRALSAYQPIAFSEDQLAERAQLLYLYTDLIWIEYRDAVRDGEISIDIEYRETITFRQQAVAIYEELRPTMAANDSSAAARLDEIYAELDEIITVIGPKADVEALVVEATGLIESGLAVDPTANDVGASLVVIDELLTQVSTAVAAGDYATAETQRIEAYAFFETGPEVKLANQAPRLAREIEGIFWEGSGNEEGLAAMIRQEVAQEVIEARIATLRAKLTEVEPFLDVENNRTVTILNGAAIILREGLEAVLIIGAIVGFMRANAEAKQYIWWVVIGVASAIVLSVALWWASNTFLVISFSNRELIEGITALVAVAVLFYVTNWLFQKVYVRDWMAFVKEQVGHALTTGSAFGLAFLGFTVVFREGLETVLFYQTLLFDSDPQDVLIGFLIGSVIIAIAAYLILQMSVRLPLKPFFNVTTVLLLIMAFNFVGKGFRGLQEAGVVNATWLSWVPENLFLIEVFGIYPTVETSLAQLVFVLLVVGTFSWSLIRANQQKKDDQRVAVS